MEKTCKTMTCGNLLHNIHNKLVVVNCDIGCLIDRSKLMLCWGNLVMLCLSCYAKLPEFNVDVLHISADSFLDRTEVVVLKLLTLRSRCAEESTSGID